MRMILVAAFSSAATAIILQNPNIIDLHMLQSFIENGITTIIGLLKSLHH